MGINPSRSFGQAARTYAAARPTYPQQLLAKALRGVTGPIVDCGAGTGLLTTVLADLGLEVIAVDPDPAMLNELAATAPHVRRLIGTAESMPIPAGSIGAVVFGQAWHWVDPDQASHEADRVLTPGGSLVLVWNIRDDATEWVGQLTNIMGLSPAERLIRDGGPTVTQPFQQRAVFTQEWVRTLTPDALRGLVRSRSPYITANPEQQRDVDHAVDQLIATHPSLAGKTELHLPYRTYAFVYQRD
ncbi:class I SAM-dependent methyltransferase [Hoyosella rhizosphaerae]|uniref:Methyltransferase n=1 Tax=Hoyosella rhizosphaerae TaxID=1755582 RepID=A0A916XAV5_9ACTN|nr:class I SAM-dependent methyltransferase [Hoyosella rhizosphaerae]MBN4926588.1 class I SAM-dependent methyltransferase [Hoyosella rhizosphaerae]GGC58089.1 putative methyltransferase [Hoyosella rhizosphaerae]